MLTTTLTLHSLTPITGSSRLNYTPTILGHLCVLPTVATHLACRVMISSSSRPGLCCFSFCHNKQTRNQKGSDFFIDSAVAHRRSLVCLLTINSLISTAVCVPPPLLLLPFYVKLSPASIASARRRWWRQRQSLATYICMLRHIVSCVCHTMGERM